jgi:hypothetical protein
MVMSMGLSHVTVTSILVLAGFNEHTARVLLACSELFLAVLLAR